MGWVRGRSSGGVLDLRDNLFSREWPRVQRKYFEDEDMKEFYVAGTEIKADFEGL